MSREYTQKEVQEKFLSHCWMMVKYWAREKREPKAEDKLEGLMHSFLSLLDGCVMEMPAFEIIPKPHPTDKEFHISEGSNYYKPFDLPEDAVTVHGNDILNDMMHQFGRDNGYIK